MIQDITQIDGHGIHEGTNPFAKILNTYTNIKTLLSTTDRMKLLNTEYDVIVIGAGPIGAALAYGLTRDAPDRKVLLVEQNWTEPDRIVGELMQPGGYQALCKLGLPDVFRGIEAVPSDGYYIEYRGKSVHIPYNYNKKTGRRFRGVTFHHGRFLQSLRAACQASLKQITCLEARVTELVRDKESGRVLGVKVINSSKTKNQQQPEKTNEDDELDQGGRRRRRSC